jgi:hypothetical protein
LRCAELVTALLDVCLVYMMLVLPAPLPYLQEEEEEYERPARSQSLSQKILRAAGWGRHHEEPEEEEYDEEDSWFSPAQVGGCIWSRQYKDQAAAQQPSRDPMCY